jgi:acyl-coenzyme A synthetase/AMP-(fatty) acid ligase
MNFAENMLNNGQHEIAVINMNEKNLSCPEKYTWQDLHEITRLYADALKASGLRKGEVVAGTS